MDTLTLTNGDEITFRDPKLISERARRRLKAVYFELARDTVDKMREAAAAGEAVPQRKINAEDLDALARLNDFSVLAVLSSWRRGGVDVDRTADNLQDLDMQSYGELSHAAAPVVEGIELDFDPTPAGVESPTAPASE